MNTMVIPGSGEITSMDEVLRRSCGTSDPERERESESESLKMVIARLASAGIV